MTSSCSASSGGPAFASSGAQPQLLPMVERARTVDLYDGRVGGYFRDPRRVARTTSTRARRGCSPRRPARASARHRVPVRPCTGGRPCDGVVPGVLPGRLVRVPLVGQGRTVAGLDGRHARARGRGRPAERGHRGHPVHQGADLAVPEAGARPPYAESTGPAPAWCCAAGRLTRSAGPGPTPTAAPRSPPGPARP